MDNNNPFHCQSFTENNRAKEVFANLVLQELMVRLMQTQARSLLLTKPA